MTTQQIELDLQKILSKNRFRGMWQLMHGFHWHYAGATLALGLSALSKTGMFILLNYLIDDVLANKVLDMLPWVALGFLGLALFEGVFTFGSAWWAAQTAEGIALRVRNYLFNHIQRLSFTYHDKAKTGELLQRATSDVDTLNRFFLQQATGIGRIVMLFLVNFIAIGFISWRLAVISVITVPVLWGMSIYFFGKIEKAYEGYQQQEAKLSTVLQENLSGVRVVKAFARQQFETKKFGGENDEKFRLGIKLLMIHALYWPVTDVIAATQMIAGFYVGAIMAINGDITIGNYLAYAGMLIWIVWPMRNLGRLIVQGSTALVSYGRVSKIINEMREPMEAGNHPEESTRGEISFENVTFAYAGEEPVLHNVSFRAKPGQVIALMGSTGSGKTSVVNLLPRFYEYTDGRVLLDGKNLNTYSRQYLRSQIGIVEQEPFLFSRTIRENIAYGVGRAVTDEDVFAAARAAAVHEVILEFPKGYSTLVGERGVTLSGGQKQRIAIARTILKNPRILILDDATSSVDTETEAAIRNALENLMVGRTTFIIAHRIQTVIHADQILVFDKGHIVQQGTHTELLNESGGIYSRIYEVQAQIDKEVQQEIA